MSITNEKYIDSFENFNVVHAFMRKVFTLTGKPQTWEFVRLEFWKTREASKNADPNFMENNAHLWKNESCEIVGLFISESGGSYFSLIVHPDYPEIAKEMIFWTKNVWGKDKKKLNTDCYEHSMEVGALLNSGFVRDRQIANTRRYDLENKEYTVTLEEGFSIRCITEAPNYVGKSESIQRAFCPQDLNPEKVAYWRKELPSYCADLDLSVVSHCGDHISFCFGFEDIDNGIAIIETIGTHPDYQQRGFGKAVVMACCNELKKRGIKTVYITGFSVEANALYQSLQPVEIFPLVSYTYEG